MLLRESGKASGDSYDEAGIGSAATAEVGVAAEEAILAFAEAAVRRDESALAAAREAIVAEMGAPALVDAAATAAAFNSVVKLADGVGIDIEDFKRAPSAEIRSSLNLPDKRESTS